MKREFLENLGLEKEVIEKIMDENGRDINKLKASNDQLKGQVDELKGELSDRGKELDTLKADVKDNEDFKAKITELQNKYDASQKDFDARVKKMNIDHAVDLALQKRQAKNQKAAKALLDFDKITLNEDGSVTGLGEQLDVLAKSDSYLFGEVKPQGSPVQDGNPIEQGKGIGAKMAEQFNSAGSALNW